MESAFGLGSTGRVRRRAGRAPGFLLERFESRVLLSAVTAVPSVADLAARPTFVAYRPEGGAHKGLFSRDVTPFNTSAPTGTTPTQMRHAYGADQINFNGPAGDGSGQTIAIVDAFDQPNAAGDLDAFNQFFNLQRMNQPGGPTFTKVDQNGGSSFPTTDVPGGWGVEISLDIEWAHVIAPQANILLVEANSASDTDLLTAVDTARNHAGVSVVSMSWGGGESSGETALDSHFLTPAGHTNVSFFASTGDNGAPGGWPAFSPDVVAVGGTTLNVDASGNYISETGWSGSGGGISTIESQPSYQSGKVPQSSASRTIPDISMDADPATGVPVYDTFDFGTSLPWAQFGGTSLACPMTAAEVAIADQGHVIQSGTTLDGISGTLPALYNMPARSNSGEFNFHDIISGNNGFPAGVGYDLVTGIGSVGNAMALTLSGVSIPRLAFAQQPTNTNAGNNITPAVTVDVLNASGQLVSTDHSNVTLNLIGGGTLNGTLTVAAVNGVATFSDLSINLAGSYNLQATDGTLGPALSNAFAITPATASKLVYIQPPTSANLGAIISPAIKVAVEDTFGNIVTGDTSGVTLAVATGPGTLSGTLTRNASGGVAIFNDLEIFTAGFYTLTASDGALTSVTSGSFKISPAPARVLSISRMSPPGPLTSDSTVQFQVAFNETVTGVDASDFSLALNGVTAATPVVVSGSGASYTVTINGISPGSGSLGLNLVDNGSIRDAVGNPLQGGGAAVFQTQITSATGLSPTSVASADINGDGKPDLVVANYGGNSVSVLLGNGDGAFHTQQVISIYSPQFVTLADINGDGKPDLIVQSFGYGAVLLGNGNGTFQPKQQFYANTNKLIVTDINGDGKPDLVCAELYDVSVLLGNGNGTFQAPRTFGAGAYTESVAAADLNGDGKPDLIVTYRTTGFETANVLLSNGDGTFERRPGFQIPVPYTNSLTTADVNGDGRADLIFAYRGGNNVNVLLGNGNGTFQNGLSFATGIAPVSVAVSDVNGDGMPDLIVTNTGYINAPGHTVSVLLGNGNGAFKAQQTFAAGSYPQSVIATDVNGDGKPDLIVANYGSNSVGVLLGNGNGDFTGQVYTIVPNLDTITGTAGIDQITLVQNPDHLHIDWTIGATTEQMSINDLAGLTINSGGSNDVINLDYSHGNPLPNTIHLNGTFTVSGLTGTNPLAGTSFEIGKSTVYISYSASNPLSAIQGYLRNGYNGGAWNGTPTASTGVITSISARTNNGYMIGYADSADGVVSGQPANTVELKYTLGGDLNLAGTVVFSDFALVVANYGKPAVWDTGAITYGATVSFADFALTVANYGKQANTTAAAGATTVASGSAPVVANSKMPEVAPAAYRTPASLSHSPRFPKRHR